jgi:hypothetical protein
MSPESRSPAIETVFLRERRYSPRAGLAAQADIDAENRTLGDTTTRSVAEAPDE